MKYSFVLGLFTFVALCNVKAGSVSSFITGGPQQQQKSETRVYHHRRYEVACKAGFIIYSSDIITTKIPNKGIISSKKYFFSRTAGDTLLPLNISNLEWAYPADVPFHYALEQSFRLPENLTAWDPFEKMYKVQYLYLQSISSAAK